MFQYREVAFDSFKLKDIFRGVLPSDDTTRSFYTYGFGLENLNLFDNILFGKAYRDLMKTFSEENQIGAMETLNDFDSITSYDYENDLKSRYAKNMYRNRLMAIAFSQTSKENRCANFNLDRRLVNKN